jgi:hypothetical protein
MTDNPYDNDDFDEYESTTTRTVRSSSNSSTTDYDAGTVVSIGEDGVTRKVKLDLEIDTSTKDLGPNPFVKWVHLAKTLDAWRPFPRIFITVYIILLYKVVNWFMGLDEPNLEQSGLVSIVVGAGAAWFGLYVGSGRGRSSRDE